MSSNEKALLEAAKKNAAIKAVEEHVRSNMIIGIGSGSTIKYAVEHIAKLYYKSDESKDKDTEKKDNNNDKCITNITCVPTSYQSQQLIIDYKLPLGLLELNENIDITIDGADEIDEDLNLIKGGGGCHLNEKMVAARTKTMIIISDWTKESKMLGENWKKGVPISFFAKIGFNYIKNKIINTFKDKKYGDTKEIKVNLRMAANKAGPIITDEGHMIIDVDFGKIDMKKIKQLDSELHNICGIIETGLFIDLCDYVYLGMNKDNKVKCLKKKK